LSFLCRNLKQCSRSVKLDAYKTYVEPILNYAATVWSSHTLCNIQKRAARFIVKDYWRTSSITTILNSLNLKSISYQHTKMRLLMFYKTVHKLVELPLPIVTSLTALDLQEEMNRNLCYPILTVDCYK